MNGTRSYRISREKVDAIRSCEERRGDQVYGCVLSLG
jgi:hypothetical protein